MIGLINLVRNKNKKRIRPGCGPHRFDSIYLIQSPYGVDGGHNWAAMPAKDSHGVQTMSNRETPGSTEYGVSTQLGLPPSQHWLVNPSYSSIDNVHQALRRLRYLRERISQDSKLPC